MTLPGIEKENGSGDRVDFSKHLFRSAGSAFEWIIVKNA
jgi:hypothetical protein